MANHEIRTDPWVDQQLTNLLLPDNNWMPNEAKALAALHSRHTGRSSVRRWWIGVPLATSLTGAALFFIPTPRACAQNPVGCAERVWASMVAGRTVQNGFKQVGSQSAPVAAEIYFDYECPPCATFFREVLPKLQAEYVHSGKLKLIFRDLPIARHHYANLAARYANAAGQFGYYDAARKQLFETQGIWSKTGDIELQLAQVIPAEIMSKMRPVAASEGSLIEDQISAEQNHINRTPSLIIVFQGRRQIMPGDNSYASIKAYLDSLAAR
jgi:protein-disulfide isomerase